jgi:hypothetical protein
MTDDHTPTLQDIAPIRTGGCGTAERITENWSGWLRGIAAKCRLPIARRELLNLAGRYERRAEHFELRARRAAP